MRRVAIVLHTLSLALTIPLAGQEITKPRAPTQDRLPPPAKIAAAQQPDGSIRVVWTSVEGAERYALTRSVPPAGAAAVDLPNPTDTFYLDRDVKPGSAYYYVVSATNESGITGLRRGSAPVTATAPAGTGDPQPPHSSVRAMLAGNQVRIDWDPVASFSTNQAYDVTRRVGLSDRMLSERVGAAVRCCELRDNLPSYPAGTRVQYYVVSLHGIMNWSGSSSPIVLSGPATDTSAAGSTTGDTTSGRAPSDTSGGKPPADTTTSVPPADTTGGGAPSDTSGGGPSTEVRPALVPPAATIKVGGSLPLGKSSAFTGLHLQKPKWSSLDETVATVDGRGRVLGRAAGFTYIVAVGLTRTGAVASLVQRVDVRRQ